MDGSAPHVADYQTVTSEETVEGGQRGIAEVLVVDRMRTTSGLRATPTYSRDARRNVCAAAIRSLRFAFALRIGCSSR